MKVFIALLLFPFFLIAQNSSFKVDHVPVTKVPLKEYSFKELTESQFHKPVLSCSDTSTNDLLVGNRFNGFLYTIHRAFADHRHLELSPDDIWLTICQGFSNHVSTNKEELEFMLLKEDHPDSIVVTTDPNIKEKHNWDQVIASFNTEILSFSNDEFQNLLIKKFTTTTPVITTTYQATLMDVTSHYINYTSMTMCGIPSITLLGSSEDWKKIYSDIDQFNYFGMEEWVSELKPVIREFVNASEGNPNVEFWQSIYKNVEVYDKRYISGWIIKFFPYLIEDVSTATIQYKPNLFIEGNRYLISDITIDNVPKGRAKTTFFWIDYTVSPPKKQELLLCSGFIGMKQNVENMSLRPNIGWAICEANPEKNIQTNYKFYWQDQDEDIKHNQEWFNEISGRAKELPIYNPKKNKTFESGVTDIQDKLNSSGLFKLDDHPKIKVEITREGFAFVLEIKDATEKQKTYIKKVIEQSNHKWSPAKTLPEYSRSTRKTYPINYDIELTI
jgi:hypothetical protein